MVANISEVRCCILGDKKKFTHCPPTDFSFLNTVFHRMEKDKDSLKREAEDAKAALDTLVHEKVSGCTKHKKILLHSFSISSI